jgi:cytidylate kinase
MIIAVDGPAASGKGTLARKLAAHYGLPHLDTGLLYRAVGYGLKAKGLPLDDEEGAAAFATSLDLGSLKAQELRSDEAGEAASKVAVFPKVRAALLTLQQEFAAQSSGAVLDGRDIGTVICPEAEVKFFITATPEARAMRRFTELQSGQPELTYEAVLADIKRRDARDAGRDTAPMLQAIDAHFMDTTQMTVAEVLEAAIGIVQAAN